jgi:hypothetical protein
MEHQKPHPSTAIDTGDMLRVVDLHGAARWHHVNPALSNVKRLKTTRRIAGMRRLGARWHASDIYYYLRQEARRLCAVRQRPQPASHGASASASGPGYYCSTASRLTARQEQSAG